ncbi:DUF58 domain-containing protein [Actinosynnema sp. NPDC020468]|uniref:DUF58 domain-containing protein n=1 Tax=Actinosynnema sp. NPDC020468 TaxID=3154488 RepID=UPI0033DCB648
MTRADRLREAFRAGRGAHWHATDALVRGVALGVGLVVVGSLVHRVELVLIGAPLLVSTLFALVKPVGGTPSVTVVGLPRTGEVGEARSVVEVDPGEGAEVIAIRLPAGTPGPGPVHLLPARVGPITVALRRDAWGEGVDLRPDHLVAGPDALLVHGPVTAGERGRVVLPPVAALPAGLLPARPVGLVGAHRARRPGDSVELRDIRAFQPGDRMRRIDWRVSLRSGNLHVREHHAEADADVVLALDTRVDVGPEVADWSTSESASGVRPGGSLDQAVRTAVSLAANYLRQGDRVSLVDLGRPQLGVRPGVGRRHLLRLRNQLVVCARSAGWSPRPVLTHHQLPHGALLIVLSPFLDQHTADLTVHAARSGHPVLALDLLPSPLVPDPGTPWSRPALRILELEHDTRLTALRRQGIPVVAASPPLGHRELAVQARRVVRSGRRTGAFR